MVDGSFDFDWLAERFVTRQTTNSNFYVNMDNMEI